MRALTALLALALLGSLGLTWRTHSNLQAERLAHQTTRTQHASALADAHAQHRKTEQDLLDAQEDHAAQAQAFHVDLDHARAAARMESVRLRDAINAATQRARAGCAAPATSDLRQAAEDPIGVLAHVLGRADERASVLADLADRRGIAGRACEREYDTARQALKE